MIEGKLVNNLKVGDHVWIRHPEDRAKVGFKATITAIGRKYVSFGEIVGSDRTIYTWGKIEKAENGKDTRLPCRAYHPPTRGGCADMVYESREQMQETDSLKEIVQVIVKTYNHSLGSILGAETNRARLLHFQDTLRAIANGQEFPVFKADTEVK